MGDRNLEEVAMRLKQLNDFMEEMNDDYSKQQGDIKMEENKKFWGLEENKQRRDKLIEELSSKWVQPPLSEKPSFLQDDVNQPKHYKQVPNVECIQVTENFNFNRGNAIKYIWRAGYKDDIVKDLRKAKWYIEREIERIERERELDE